MEIIQDSTAIIKSQARLSVRYKMWKQSLHKWDEYVFNRRSDNKKIDQWSRYIVDHCVGNTAVYNSGGLFFKDFLPNIQVIEHSPCPVNVPGMTYINKDTDLTNSFDSLIMVNPIAVKYHHSLKYFFTVPGISRIGFKPNILNWVKLNGKIFLSFSDWHLFFDRLKYTPTEFIEQQLVELETIGLKCVFKTIEKSTADYINGNVKLVFVRENVYN